MPLDQTNDIPDIDRVLFQVTLFGDFCETGDTDPSAAGGACECLRDAVWGLCRLSEASSLSPRDRAILKAALHQAHATFRDAMPTLYDRTRALRGFEALMDLVTSSASVERCEELEHHAAISGRAERFGKTLGTFSASLAA